MGLTRRAALRAMLTAGAAAAGVRQGEAAAVPPPDAVGLLYDATLCIGCKTCTVACREANGLAPDTTASPGGLYQAPLDLSARAKTVIKLYRDGPVQSFIKVQCNHCLDPACASACMLGALKKREFGVVTYDPDLCIGCRYCEVACPFNVPKFEFASRAPKIVKCELCKERLARGQEPACTEVCTRKAVVLGRRTELLKDAKRRIAENPERYVPRVYGETEAGGTQVLYLSHVPFEKLGLPALDDEPAPQLARTIQHGVYRDLIAPMALYAAAMMAMVRNRRAENRGREETHDGDAG